MEGGKLTGDVPHDVRLREIVGSRPRYSIIPGYLRKVAFRYYPSLRYLLPSPSFTGKSK